MDDLSIPKLKEGLDRRYKTFVDTQVNYQYSAWIYGYISYISAHPVLNRIAGNIDKDHVNDLKNIEKLKVKAFKEIEAVYDDITAKTKKEKFIHNPLFSLFESYDLYKKGAIISSRGVTGSLYDAIEEIIVMLYGLGKVSFIEKYVIFGKDPMGADTIRDFKISESYEEVKEINKRMERAKDITIWGALENLVKTYKAFEYYIADINAPDSSGIGATKFSRGFYIEAVEALKRGERHNMLLSGDPKLSLQRFHLGMLDELDREETEAKMEKNTNSKNIVEQVKDEQEESLNPKIKPFTVIIDGGGYLKFYKEGPKISIAKADTRQFKLIKALSDPLNVFKSVEVVFEDIRIKKDKENPDFENIHIALSAKIAKIVWAIKEIQKIKKLDSRLKFEFDEQKKNIRMFVGSAKRDN